ncbi:hypothetical protein ACI2KR_31055 [Pseudomonas luteola]
MKTDLNADLLATMSLEETLKAIYEVTLEKGILWLTQEQDFFSIHRLELNYGCKAVEQAMKDVDPERRVFDRPIAPGEKGIHGLEFAKNRFTFLSDIYGHDVEQGWDEKRQRTLISRKDVKRCEAGYENGELHDAGFVAFDHTIDKGGFLVVLRLEPSTVPVAADLQALSQQYGAQFACYAWPNIPCHYTNDSAYAAITAFVEGFERLDEIGKIYQAVSDLEDRWTGK